MTRDGETQPTPAGGIRYLISLVFWLVWFALCLALAFIAQVLLPALVSVKGVATSVQVAIVVLVFVLVGLPGGWIGAVIAKKIHADARMWWAPSLAAAAVLLATSVALGHISFGTPGSLILNVALFAPLFIGQWLGTGRRRAAVVPE